MYNALYDGGLNSLPREYISTDTYCHTSNHCNIMVESSSSSTPQCVDSASVSSSTTSTILRRRQVPTLLASENNDDDAPNKIIQEEEDDALSRCEEVRMNKSSDDLVAEEDGYIDNENRDLQSLIELIRT